MRVLWELFVAFFKIGAFTFGGGYAMLPLIEKEIVEKRGYATSEEVMDYFAIGQCTPGVIAVNTATFVGHKKAGIKGAASATLGVVLPSLIIITTIAMFLSSVYKYPVVQHILSGIRVAVAVLIVNATYSMFKKGCKDIYTVILAVISFVAFAFFSLPPVLMIVFGVVAGLVIKKVKGGNGQ